MNAAGAAQAVTLVENLFGADLDAAILTKATDPPGARCQKSVLTATQQLSDRLFKAAFKEKKLLLAGKDDGTLARSDAVLQMLLTEFLTADAGGKIAAAESAVRTAARGSCDARRARRRVPRLRAERHAERARGLRDLPGALPVLQRLQRLRRPRDRLRRVRRRARERELPVAEAEPTRSARAAPALRGEHRVEALGAAPQDLALLVVGEHVELRRARWRARRARGHLGRLLDAAAHRARRRPCGAGAAAASASAAHAAASSR